MRKRRGIQYPSFNPVNFALECPVHANELRLENPVGKTPNSGHVTYESQRLWCPQAGGHTFNIEDCNATIFNDDGSVADSGVPVNGHLGSGGLTIGGILLG